MIPYLLWSSFALLLNTSILYLINLKMILNEKSFLNRIYRAIKIDPDLYEEVEHDKSATFQAASVVVFQV